MEEDQSGLYKTISTLGKVVAAAAGLLLTPMLYEASKRPLFAYFAKTWGRDLADILVMVMGTIEAYLIYTSVSLLISAGTIWAITALTMRRFKD